MTTPDAVPRARVQKLLAQAGIASRRKCEELIVAGRVSVNNAVAKLGTTATTEDDIRVDGIKVRVEEKVYIMLHKPVGVTTTVSDPHAEHTVLDLVPVAQRIFPAGRLDKQSEGLVILTNDGELMQQLTHPSKDVWKTYEATSHRPVDERAITRLANGVTVEDRVVKTRGIERVGPNTLRLQIHEGRKHIVRLLFSAIGLPLRRLVRTAMGPLQLGTLRPGKWRRLTETELAAVRGLGK